MDAPQGVVAPIRLDEMASSLAWLEAQIGQVLGDDAAPEADDHVEALLDTDAEVLCAASAPVTDAPAGGAPPKPYVAGITLDQIDELVLLLDSAKAYGDVVTAADHAEYAAPALSIIGYALYKEISEIRDIIYFNQNLKSAQHRRPGARRTRHLPRPAGAVAGCPYVVPHSTAPDVSVS